MQSQQSKPKAAHVLSVSAMHCVCLLGPQASFPHLPPPPRVMEQYATVWAEMPSGRPVRTCCMCTFMRRHVNLWGLLLSELEAGKHYQGGKQYGPEGRTPLNIWYPFVSLSPRHKRRAKPQVGLHSEGWRAAWQARQENELNKHALVMCSGLSWAWGIHIWACSYRGIAPEVRGGVGHSV